MTDKRLADDVASFLTAAPEADPTSAEPEAVTA